MSVITRVVAGAAVAALGCAAVGATPSTGPRRGDPARLAATSSPCQYLNNQQPSGSPGVPWYMNTDSMHTAQQLSKGTGIKIGVVDSGVNDNGNQLAGAVRGGGDFTGRTVELGGSAGLTDVQGHGTGVAGIIAARPEPGTGVVGVAPGATVYSFRTNVGDTSYGTTMVAAINAAVADKMNIINISQTINASDDPETKSELQSLQQAVDNALGNGILVVAAAGNNYQSKNPVEYPAAIPGVLAVGGSTSTGTVLAFSEQQSYVDVLGPGNDIDVVLPNNGAQPGASQQNSGYQYCADAGTSFASPYVAGVAALMLQQDNRLDPATVIAILESTAANQGTWTPGSGWGMVQPGAAVRAVDQYRANPSVGAASVRTIERNLTAQVAKTATVTPSPYMISPHLPVKLTAAERTQRFGTWIAVAATLLLGALLLGGAAVVRDRRRRRGGA